MRARKNGNEKKTEIEWDLLTECHHELRSQVRLDGIQRSQRECFELFVPNGSKKQWMVKPNHTHIHTHIEKSSLCNFLSLTYLLNYSGAHAQNFAAMKSLGGLLLPRSSMYLPYTHILMFTYMYMCYVRIVCYYLFDIVQHSVTLQNNDITNWSSRSSNFMLNILAFANCH